MNEQELEEFEEGWRSGLCPKIEDLLEKSSRPHSDQLLFELLNIEIFYRQKVGDYFAITDYIRRFPKAVRMVSRVFSEMERQRHHLHEKPEPSP